LIVQFSPAILERLRKANYSCTATEIVDSLLNSFVSIWRIRTVNSQYGSYCEVKSWTEGQNGQDETDDIWSCGKVTCLLPRTRCFWDKRSWEVCMLEFHLIHSNIRFQCQ